MFRLSAVLVGVIAASSNPELLDEVWSYTYYSRSPDYWQDQGDLGSGRKLILASLRHIVQPRVANQPRMQSSVGRL